MPETAQKITQGWCIWKTKHINSNKLPVHLKRKAFNQCIVQAVVYELQTGKLTTKVIQRGV